MMATAYNAPELCNFYCANECPIGKLTTKEVNIKEFDRLALQVLGSLKNMDTLRSKLISIAEDGVISNDEHDEFNSVLESLQKISTNAQALQLWACKFIEAYKLDYTK